MGWFDKQIRQREDLDQQLFEDSLFRVAGVILGQSTAAQISDTRIITKQAIDEILKYYHYKPVEIPASLKQNEEQLDYCLRPHGLMKRSVTLEDGWYRDCFGPILAFRAEDGAPVALLPDRISGYYFTDSGNGEHIRLNRKTAKQFARDAYCFYRPLPQRKIGIPDLLVYMKNCMSGRDMLWIVLSTLAVVLVGQLLPVITKGLTGPVVSSGRQQMLIGAAACLFCIALSSHFFSCVKEMLYNRIQSKTSLGIQASMMMRILTLPASFFRKSSAGELTSRALSVSQLCNLLLGVCLSTGLTSAVSLLYIRQIFKFAPVLVLPSLAVLLLTLLLSVATTLVQNRVTRLQMEHSAKEAGMSYAMISGIQKIKLAGAEKRMFARWLQLYTEGAKLTYRPPALIRFNGVIRTAITLFSTILLYNLAVQGGVSPSSYLAFTAAYGTLSGAFMALSGMAVTLGAIHPILETAKPFLQTVPEAAENKEIVTRISGSVELNNVYFRYAANQPYLADDLTLRIRAGEYIALVGRTGCGKSTLVRLLLGFEKPEKGAIYYDGRDIDQLDLSTLRRKIGAVMQDDRLLQGDIYSNIVISAPELSLDEAWEAAETAGIADDIRAMPMGMHTIISEGQGGISGGQKQRIMIARAIAPKPKLLIFDEATSALDNKTQKQVSDALDSMGCTRIVIAHRLSTIRHCDRILVLDHGKIIEDGSYDELIAKNGFFAELVARQRLGTEP